MIQGLICVAFTDKCHELWQGGQTSLVKFDEAKATSPQSEALDPAIKSCRDFAVSQSHLDAAYHIVTKGYKEYPGQKKPVQQIEGVETPEKLEEFMAWYASGEHDEKFSEALRHVPCP